MKGILGRKIGMTSVFAKDGKLIPVTKKHSYSNILSPKRKINSCNSNRSRTKCC